MTLRLMRKPDIGQIDQMAYELARLKAEEARVRAERIELEVALASSIACKDEGTEHQTGDYYKVTVTNKLNRTLNAEVWEQIGASIDWPSAECKAVVYKPEINLTALRALELANPAIYKKLSAAITVKPGKPTVKVEELANGT